MFLLSCKDIHVARKDYLKRLFYVMLREIIILLFKSLHIIMYRKLYKKNVPVTGKPCLKQRSGNCFYKYIYGILFA